MTPLVISKIGRIAVAFKESKLNRVGRVEETLNRSLKNSFFPPP